MPVAQINHARAVPSRRRRLLGAGGTLFLAGLALFLSVLDGVRGRTDLSVWDSPVLRWLLTHRSGAATAVFARISWLADPPVLATVGFIVIVTLVWRTRRVRPGLLLGGALAVAVATSSAVKVLVARPRPPLAVMITPRELDFAFPSGHTLGAATFLLVLSYLWWVRRPTARVALAGLAVSALGTIAVGVSRLYLGYHWLTDVSASATLAIAILGGVVVVDALIPWKPAPPDHHRVSTPPVGSAQSRRTHD